MCTSSCKKEGVSSSCSTNTASTSSASTSTDKAKGVVCLDKFVSQAQPVTVMKGEKFSTANELLVKALTCNLLPSALLDSPEFRDFLTFFFQKIRKCILHETLDECIFLRQNSKLF